MGKPFTNAQGALFGMDVTDPLLGKPQDVTEYRFCTDALNGMMDLLTERYGTDKLQAVISENTKRAVLQFQNYAFEVDMSCEEVQREDGVALILEEDTDTFYLLANGCRITPRSADEKKENCDLLYVEEGSFQNGLWKRKRRLNGDEVFSPVYNEFTLLKMKLYAYGNDL